MWDDKEAREAFLSRVWGVTPPSKARKNKIRISIGVGTH